MRDDFSEAVKRAVAARAGYRCSKPDCDASTSGPQVRRNKAVSVGVAAHITAAAMGGPRYDETLTPAERAGVENAIWVCSVCGRLVDGDVTRFSVATLHMWKANREAAAQAELGRPRGRTSGRPRSPEAEIKRNLKLRDRLRKDLLKSSTEIRDLPRPHHPYKEFAHGGEAIIRAVDDKSYPSVDESPGPGISGWFKVELYDFYHNGVEVILNLQRGLVDKRGNWKIIHHDATYDAKEYEEIKVWTLGRIPWRNIRECDPPGDEYYSMPHLFCRFADDGTPYEEFVYAALGEGYDVRLEKGRRLADE